MSIFELFHQIKSDVSFELLAALNEIQAYCWTMSDALDPLESTLHVLRQSPELFIDSVAQVASHSRRNDHLQEINKTPTPMCAKSARECFYSFC